MGAEAAEFVGFESDRDSLGFGRGDGNGGLGGAVVVDVDAGDEAGARKRNSAWAGTLVVAAGGEEVSLDNTCSLIEVHPAEMGIPILRGDEGWGCVDPWSYTNWD